MEGYKPPFTITNSILSYVASISEKVGRITVMNNMENKPHLRRNNRIKSIHSSLKIEANSLSLSQVRDVINGKVVLGEQKEIQEVKNAYNAYEKIAGINPYSIKDLKNFHGIMTKYIVEESGDFRRGEEGVFNGEQCIFMAPPAQFVPQLMNELFDWMKEADGEVHSLILSSVFHYEFVFIHLLMVMAEWRDYGIQRFYLNGIQYLSISLLRVRLKNFRMNIMMRLPDVMFQENLPFL